MINAFKQISLSNLNVSGSQGRLNIGNSGSLAYSSELSSATAYLSGELVLANDRIDETWSVIDGQNNNISGLIVNANYLTSGYSEISTYIPGITGALEALSLQNQNLFDLYSSHDDRLSGIDDTITYLVDQVSASLNPAQQSFSYPIASGYEDYTVLFPSGQFEAVPTINVSLESEVGYMFTLRNKTVSGFDIGFSDIIKESGVSIDVFASAKF